VTSVAVPDVELMAQKWAFWRSSGKTERPGMMSSKVHVGILVLDPHGLGRVDGRCRRRWRRSSRGWKARMASSALHDGLDGGIALDALVQLDLHAGGLEVGLDVLEEAASGACCWPPETMTAFLPLRFFTSWRATLAEVQVARIGETSHGSSKSTAGKSCRIHVRGTLGRALGPR
jgi:hypothetical protein